ncbi:sulfate ABC transporter permease [Vibrio sp. 10N.286.49.C2]|uniref:porin n=1 Tax=unclassified Vibrio TaxID=2614977 RepID=UPI000C84C1F3|nr:MULTISPECIES: porin [unclassified Vibrio]PMH36779.1 sulfate ABC transporter permease [Vibrio sp. 10N.286.49.C2]PMH54912.1 sulfate ABC transporter permease [Vibrio sp. 10N.286.49.B1]PMH78332.1 sulfate ABC transporter permease [Vibrio sp. 10N.286.48.B7]
MKYIITPILTVASLPVYSAIDITDNFSISGFGSTSWARSDNETPLLINRSISDENCFDCDTTFGVQLDYYRSDFKASVQVVKRPQDDWSGPSLEWAYVGYAFDDIEVRAGRQRLPLFLASEYFYVGQAYTTARPPAEVYSSLLGITAYNGASVSWNKTLNDEMQLVLTPFVGFNDNTSIRFNSSVELEFDTKNLWGLNAQLVGDYYRWNAAVLNGTYDVTSRVTITSPFVPQPFVVADTNEETVNQYTLGAEYEFGDLKATFEFQKTESVRTDWYTMFAYRMAPFTPYVAYGQLYQDSERSNASSTLGVRYDVLNNVSINAEYQYFQILNEGSGLFIEDPEQDDSANLFTVMVSFVF